MRFWCGADIFSTTKLESLGLPVGGFVCMILCLAVLVERRLVTDTAEPD